MKRILFFILLLAGFASFAFAQEVSNLQNANDLYSQAEYSQAASIYEQVLKEQGAAPEVYYNLGNAYYKMGEIGLSILNYERAVRLNPHFEDAVFNLGMAQSRVVDNIKATEPFFLKRWIHSLLSMCSSNIWLYISCGLFILCIICFFFFVFSPQRSLRKVSFSVSIIVMIISAFTLFFSVVHKNQMISHDDAIIMTGVVTVKSSPDRSGTDLFELHEGTKVTIKNQLGEWIEIVIGDMRTGWVEKRQIEQI